jgi:hypothetical protein
MNSVNHWLAPDVLCALGMALAHFLWQGAAIAALAAGAIGLARRAATRYVFGVTALTAMFVAPVITYLILQDGPLRANASAEIAAPAMANLAGSAARTAVGLAAHTATSTAASVSLLNWFVAWWFAGVVLFSLRTAGGFFLVARMRRRFCESLHLDAPAVLGWFRPVVFLPVSALTGLTETQLCAVIAHELAHIRRYDAFVNLFQVAVETLLFYHPAVWWLSKRVRAERENCCDDVALGVCENAAEYARALALMEEWRVAPSFAMAANRGPLASRVARLLGLGEKGSSLRNAGVAFGVLCVATALIAGNALFGVLRTAAAQHSSAAAQAPAAEPSSVHVVTVTAPRPVPTPKRAGRPVSAPEAIPALAAWAGQEPPVSPKAQSYIDGMKAEGFENLTADELIAMRVQGITPQYIHEMRAEGLKPSIDDLIGMKVQGITPDYIHQMRALKLDTNVDSLIGMKVQGITPDYVNEMRKLGFSLNTDQLIAMKVQGITPQYVDEIRKLGFQPNADEIVGMKVQGITPQYVEEMRKLGFKPDPDQLIGMKVQGISPEYVKQLNDLGLHPDADDAIGMKVQGINADYIRSIRATGLNPDKDDLIGLKVQGVTAEYIKGIQGAGFKPDVEEIISAKVQGVTPEFILKAQSHGFKNLDLGKIIRLKQAGVLE